MWVQREIRLRPRPRGFHLVTREVLEGIPEVGDVRVGLLHVFIRHTSASLTLNENASPDVRDDFVNWGGRQGLGFLPLRDYLYFCGEIRTISPAPAAAA